MIGVQPRYSWGSILRILGFNQISLTKPRESHQQPRESQGYPKTLRVNPKTPLITPRQRKKKQTQPNFDKKTHNKQFEKQQQIKKYTQQHKKTNQ